VRSGSATGPGPFLVLAHIGDDTAAEVALRLRRRVGPARVRVVTPEELVLAPSWAHVIDGSGVRTRIRLASGEVIGEPGPLAVFNRLRFVTPIQFDGAATADREYATMELHALVLSWLASMGCPVVNRPSPRGLGGDDRTTLEWLRLASRAGLPVRAMRATTDGRGFAVAAWPARPYAVRGSPDPGNGGGDDTGGTVVLPRGRRPALFAEPVDPERARLLVVGDRVLADPILEAGLAALRAGAQRLAADGDTALLELSLARGTTRRGDHQEDPAGGQPAPGWLVTGVDPFPEVREPGALDSIASMLLALAADHAGSRAS
jgi:hypothetical protein